VDDRLFFAGEACSQHDYSTAHGLSGGSQGVELTSAFGRVAKVHGWRAWGAFDANDPELTLGPLIGCKTLVMLALCQLCQFDILLAIGS
jgi:hypothetical protein